MSPAARGEAPGKAILFGEHAAVYGHPCIAAALGRTLTVEARPAPPRHGSTLRFSGPAGVSDPIPPRSAAEVEAAVDRGEAIADVREARVLHEALALFGLTEPVQVEASGDLPLGVGLGSSGAFSIALLRALCALTGRPLERPALLEAGQRLEDLFHGRASGVDHTVAAVGGCLRYQSQPTRTYTQIALGAPLTLLVAAVPRLQNAKALVAGVRSRREASPAHFDALFAEIAALTTDAEAALRAGDRPALGRLMDANHRALDALGVNTPETEALVRHARAAGALGAKLTGAGGGGSVLALLPEDGTDRGERLVRAVRAAGAEAFVTILGATAR